MKKTPSYRKKVVKSGRGPIAYAYVRLNGKDVPLGRHDTVESRERYDRVISEWLAAGSKLKQVGQFVTVAEVCDDYVRASESRYQGRNGKPSVELQTVIRVVKVVKQKYGSTPATEFRSLRFKTLREEFIGSDLSRGVIQPILPPRDQGLQTGGRK